MMENARDAVGQLCMYVAPFSAILEPDTKPEPLLNVQHLIDAVMANVPVYVISGVWLCLILALILSTKR